jgi:type III restriction enzyme
VIFGICLKRRPTRCSAGCADRTPLYLPPLRRAKPRRRLANPRWVILETDAGLNVIAEIKGQVTDSADVKAKAAQRWANAVNWLGQHGMWHYLLVTDPGTLGKALNAYTTAKWDEVRLN